MFARRYSPELHIPAQRRVRQTPPRTTASDAGALKPQALTRNGALGAFLRSHSDVVQRVEILHQRGAPRPAIKNEIKEIVEAAEAAEGKATPRARMLKHLKKFRDEMAETVEAGSQETFGVSAANYFPNQGVAALSVQGKKDWQQEVEKGLAPGGSDFQGQFPRTSILASGDRASKTASGGKGSKEATGGKGSKEPSGDLPKNFHDEMWHISALPGTQAVVSTQRHCIFCYGVLERDGYEHEEIREKVWAKEGWHYPGWNVAVGKFWLKGDLKKGDKNFDADPIIDIKSRKHLWKHKEYRVVDPKQERAKPAEEPTENKPASRKRGVESHAEGSKRSRKNPLSNIK